MSVSGSGGCGKGMRGQNSPFRCSLKNTALWRSYPATGIRSLTVRVRNGKRYGGCAKTTCSGKRIAVNFTSAIKDGQIRCPAVPIHPKTAVASCFAMTPSEYNDTPAQPQTQAMGAARREPRRGEIPVMCASTVPECRPRLGK